MIRSDAYLFLLEPFCDVATVGTSLPPGEATYTTAECSDLQIIYWTGMLCRSPSLDMFSRLQRTTITPEDNLVLGVD